MSKELWLRAYERVYDEHSDHLSEEEMAKLADEKTASLQAQLVDEAMARLDEGE